MISNLVSQTSGKQKIRVFAIFVAFIALLALFSISISSLSLRTSNEELLLAGLYPVLLIGILMMLRKLAVGYVLTLIVSLGYAILLADNVGEYFFFKSDNHVLLLIVVLPFFLLISLIPLCTSYLLYGKKYRATVTIMSIIIALSFPIYAIANNVYISKTDTLYAEYEFNGSSTKVICKPSLADPRHFVVVSNSEELSELVKSKASFSREYYYANTAIKKNYAFGELRSISIISVNQIKLNSPVKWKVGEIQGNTEFLNDGSE